MWNMHGLNPMSDMDLEVYKDWLYEFNNNDDLRDIDFYSLVTGCYCFIDEDENNYMYHDVFGQNVNLAMEFIGQNIKTMEMTITQQLKELEIIILRI